MNSNWISVKLLWQVTFSLITFPLNPCNNDAFVNKNSEVNLQQCVVVFFIQITTYTYKLHCMKSHVKYKNYQYKQIVMFYMGISDTDMTTSLYLISAL